MENIQSIKKEIVQASQRAFEMKLFAGTSGNLSYYQQAENKLLITPTSVRYETMTVEDIVTIDLDGNILDGRHSPSSEWRMHAEIYKNRDDVKTIFHTHSPFATSFATIYKKIPTILIEMIPFLGGDIMVADFKRPGTPDVGLAALDALKDRGGCLLGSHGVLSIGATIEQVFIRAEYIEEAATIYHHALQIGVPKVI
ncbi:class II aldolase/adducin family protein [Oscillospiraceae bacterium PP1C4]